MLEERLKNIFSYISDCEKRLNRKIFLVGATKYADAETINKAIGCGLKIVAENRAQSFRDKFPLIDKNCEFHFIGSLQKNKLKYLIGKISLIQSVDCVEIAEAIDEFSKKANVVTNCLIEVNISHEQTKSGFTKGEIDFEKLKMLNNVCFRGLMTMLPNISDEDKLASYCKEAKDFYDELCNTEFGKNFEFLSMGMSHDYKIAIENGSNMIRLGRTIFCE